MPDHHGVGATNMQAASHVPKAVLHETNAGLAAIAAPIKLKIHEQQNFDLNFKKEFRTSSCTKHSTCCWETGHYDRSTTFK